MTLKTIKAAERAAYRLLKVFEPLRKTDSQAATEWDAANKLWHRFYNRRQELELAAATKRDRGVVCFTVFIPERFSMKEVIRTPHRTTHTTRWRSFYSAEYDRNESVWTDVNPFETPIQTFKRLNQPAEVRS